jgi:hypothetical protein
MASRKLVLIGAALIIIHPTLTKAADTTPVYESGNSLLRECTSQNPLDHGECLGFLEGVVDQIEVMRMMSNRPPCLPSKNIEISQIKDVVVRDLQSYPETRNQGAAVLVTQSVIKAWRCTAH